MSPVALLSCLLQIFAITMPIGEMEIDREALYAYRCERFVANIMETGLASVSPQSAELIEVGFTLYSEIPIAHWVEGGDRKAFEQVVYSVIGLDPFEAAQMTQYLLEQRLFSALGKRFPQWRLAEVSIHRFEIR